MGHFQSNESRVEFVCDDAGLSSENWMKMGCIRLDAGQTPTVLTAPAWTGTPFRCGGGTHGRGSAPAEPGGAWQPRPVRIRSAGGSGGSYSCARKGGQTRNTQQTREEPLRTVQLEFDGTLVEFREQLEKHVGHCQGICAVHGERLTWQRNADTGKIEMNASNHRVYITGKAHQIRNLVVIINPFCRRASSDGTSSIVTTARGGNRNHAKISAGSKQQGSPTCINVPSAIYSPNMFSAGSAPTLTRGAQDESSQCVAKMDFIPQAHGELELKKGDSVTITDKPEQTHANVDRWVYGMNWRLQQSGVFPSSCIAAFPALDMSAL